MRRRAFEKKKCVIRACLQAWFCCVFMLASSQFFSSEHALLPLSPSGFPHKLPVADCASETPWHQLQFEALIIPSQLCSPGSSPGQDPLLPASRSHGRPSSSDPRGRIHRQWCGASEHQGDQGLEAPGKPWALPDPNPEAIPGALPPLQQRRSDGEPF